MKKILVIGFVISIGQIIAGQDKAAELQKLFALMHTEKMVNTMMDNMIPYLKQQASDQFQGKDARKKYNEYVEYVMDETKELAKRLANEELMNIYDKHFTHEEIKELIAFYGSPTGQKLLEETPALTKELMEIMVSKYLPEFQEKLSRKLNELNNSNTLSHQ